jgi:hypothetical protein
MSPVRGGSKTLAAALAVLLLAVGLAACGGGSDSNSTAAGGSTSAQAGGRSSGEGTTGSGDGNSGSGEEAGSGSGGSESTGAKSFKPKQHHDSGGGSAQYRVKGGDNSVQEFGAEARGSDFEKAAAALHDFLDARAQADWAAACSYMSKSVVESLQRLAAGAKQSQGASCASILEKLTNPAAKQAMREEAAQANVGSLRIEGERAFLIYTGTGKTVIAMPMADEGGAWKVASLAGTPLS